MTCPRSCNCQVAGLGFTSRLQAPTLTGLALSQPLLSLPRSAWCHMSEEPWSASWMTLTSCTTERTGASLCLPGVLLGGCRKHLIPSFADWGYSPLEVNHLPAQLAQDVGCRGLAALLQIFPSSKHISGEAPDSNQTLNCCSCSQREEENVSWRNSHWGPRSGASLVICTVLAVHPSADRLRLRQRPDHGRWQVPQDLVSNQSRHLLLL